MKRAIIIVLFAALAVGMSAQKIHKSYKNVPLPQALKEMNDAQQDWHISFIYDDLSDFVITADIRAKDIPEAIGQMTMCYPIRVATYANTVLVECNRATHRLLGYVCDNDNQPIEFANIVLLSMRDSTIIAAGMTGEGGHFVIPCNADEVIMRVSYIGMKTVERRTRVQNVGTVCMQPDIYMLKTVTVNGERPKATIEGTSLVVDVEHSVMSRMGTAADVLSQVPTVMKNGDNYEVVGKGTPLIYVNGRKVQSTRELSELQSDQIKTIKVDHNPGARYDATVSSVITIKTKPVVGEGFSVEVGSWTQQGKGTTGNEWLNLTYRKQGWEVFANLFAEPHKESYEKNYYDETIVADTLWNIHNNERQHQRSNFYSGKFGFNYNTDKHSFGAYYQNDHSYSKTSENTYYNLRGDGYAYDDLTNNLFSEQKTWPNHFANIYYNGKMGKWMLDFNTDLISRKYTNTSLSSEQGERPEDSRTVTTENVYKTHMLAEKLVAVHPLWKGSIGFGEELTAIERQNNYTNAEGIFANDNNETHETTIAPFAELSQTLGNWDLTFGLRYEHTKSNYFIAGVKQTEQCRTYNQLSPSFDASTVWNNIRISFSYSPKTKRPNFTQLNSTMCYANRLSYEKGNSLLKPSLTHTVELMAMWKSYFLMTSYSQINDDIQYSIENYEGDEKIQVATYKNYDHRRIWTLTLGAQKAIGVWNINYSATMVKQWFVVTHNNGRVDTYNQPLFLFQLNNTFNLPRKWLVRLDYTLRTTGNEGIGYVCRAANELNLSVCKDFFGDKLHMQLDFDDILGTYRSDIRLVSNNFTFHRHDNPYLSSVSLTFRYRFNVINSRYKGTGAGNDAKSRF